MALSENKKFGQVLPIGYVIEYEYLDDMSNSYRKIRIKITDYFPEQEFYIGTDRKGVTYTLELDKLKIQPIE